PPGHHRDDRLGAAPHLHVEVGDVEAAGGTLVGLVPRVAPDPLIAAGAERLAALAGQDDDADRLVVARDRQGARDLLDRLRPERVVDLGTTDRDLGDPVLRGLVTDVGPVARGGPLTHGFTVESAVRGARRGHRRPYRGISGPRNIRGGRVEDDLGHRVDVDRPARRVVSLVPSLTEAIAATRAEALVGATDWCTHPTDLTVRRVRGTKNPDRRAIVDLRPDLVVANKEENRELDVRRLREAGVPVWVTDIESVDRAFASLRRLSLDGLGWGVPDWLVAAERIWAAPVPERRTRVAVAIWRDPWMVVGGRTFTGDVVRRLGLRPAFADSVDRYPRIELAV